MNEALKIVKTMENCTLFDDINFDGAENCIKTIFFNSVLGRIEQKYTQNDVSKYLKISKRTVIEFEKGKVDKFTLIYKYINKYNFDFANNKRELMQVVFKNTI